MAQTTSTASHRQPHSPISCSPSSPRPSITKGKAVPSLRPASPVRLKRSRSRSAGCSTCTSEASTGSVGARTAPSRMAAPRGSPSPSTPAAAISPTVTVMDSEGQPHRHPPARVAQRGAQLEPGGEQRDDHRHLGDALQQRRLLHRVHVEEVQRQRAHQHARRQVDHGHRERQPLHQRAGDRQQHQQRADDQEPGDRGQRTPPGPQEAGRGGGPARVRPSAPARPAAAATASGRL